MKKTKLLAVLLAGVMASSMLATGCTTSGSDSDNSGNSNTGSGQDEGPVVELSYYMMNSAVNDQDRIMEKANAIIEEKINAKLDLKMIDSSQYASKINMMIAGGEDWDLCFMADWGGMDYYGNAKDGAFADLTDKLPEIAPVSYSKVPEGIWNNMKVDGKIYGIFNYQQYGYAAKKGFVVQSELADKYGFDWKSLKDQDAITVLNALTPFFEKVHADNPDLICWETSSTYNLFVNDPLYWDMENVGDGSVPGWISYDDPTKVINQYETEEFKQYCEILRDWYNKGFVRKDGATLADVNPDRKAGKIVAQWNYSWPDCIDLPELINPDVTAMSMSDPKVGAYSFSTTRTVLPSGVNAATCINADCPNIDKALELAELLNSDDELFNLISLGEEGVDYKYNEDGNYEIIQGKYLFNYNEWQIGQSYDEDFSRSTFGKNELGEIQKESWKQVYEAEKTCEASPLSGFVFDPDPVKTEISAVSAIVTEMVPALASGSVDPAEKLPEFLERIKSAGADKIIEEKQKQLDEFNASK